MSFWAGSASCLETVKNNKKIRMKYCIGIKRLQGHFNTIESFEC